MLPCVGCNIVWYCLSRYWGLTIGGVASDNNTLTAVDLGMVRWGYNHRVKELQELLQDGYGGI